MAKEKALATIKLILPIAGSQQSPLAGRNLLLLMWLCRPLAFADICQTIKRSRTIPVGRSPFRCIRTIRPWS